MVIAVFKSSIQPLCRYCGAPIGKHTVTVRIEAEQSPNHHSYEGRSRYAYTTEKITTKAGCQKLTNGTVAAVKWHRARTSSIEGYERDPANDRITQFTEWDGETYKDAFFCNGDHAKRYAYVMARTGYQTQACADAEKKRKQPATTAAE